MNIHARTSVSSPNSAFKRFSDYVQAAAPAPASYFVSYYATPPTRCPFPTSSSFCYSPPFRLSPAAAPQIIFHRGHWTREEHRRFLEAMELYGNSWSQVRKHVGSRTTAQIRSHAQKHYSGLRRREIKRLGSGKRSAVFVVTREYLNRGSIGSPTSP